jgi:WD40-like Beta Propeller Repeat
MNVRLGFTSLALFSVALAACVGDSPGPVGSSGTPGKPDATTTMTPQTDAATDAPVALIDAGPDANLPIDADSDAASRPCDPLANFATPTPVAELNVVPKQNGARITPGGLELYLTREDSPSSKPVYHYKRATLSDTWSFLAVEAALTVPVTTGGVTESASSSLTFAGEMIAYLSVFQGGAWKIFSTTRVGAGLPWKIPTQAINSINASDEFPWLNAAGDRLYFMSSRIGGFHLFLSRPMGTVFPTPTQLTLDTANTANQYAPVLTNDGKTLYFSGSMGQSRYVYKSTGSDATFTATVKDPTLNIVGKTTSQVSWISPDSCEVYLTIDDKIYKARKP